MKTRYIIVVFAVLALISIALPSTELFGSEKKNNTDNLSSNRNLPTAMRVDGTEIAPNKKAKNDKNNVYSESDTSRGNKISKIIMRGDVISVKIELKDWDEEIELSAYNLLGKKILEIYKGRAVRDLDYEYEFNSSSIPNGIYLCVLHGRNIRDAKRFVISR